MIIVMTKVWATATISDVTSEMYMVFSHSLRGRKLRRRYAAEIVTKANCGLYKNSSSKSQSARMISRDP